MGRKKSKSNEIFLKIGLLVFFALVILPVKHIKADDAIVVDDKFKKTVVYSKEDEKTGYLFSVSGLYGDSLKDVKVKSSNKSVAVIESVFMGSFEVHPKKPGTTKITITAVMNNKKVKKTGTVKVVPFQNPFKSLKVGGRKYQSKVKGSYNYIVIKTKEPNVKLNYKINSKWKIVQTNAYGTEQISNTGIRNVKNGMNYSVESGETLMLYIKVKNKKNKAEIGTVLHIMR